MRNAIALALVAGTATVASTAGAANRLNPCSMLSTRQVAAVHVDTSCKLAVGKPNAYYYGVSATWGGARRQGLRDRRDRSHEEPLLHRPLEDRPSGREVVGRRQLVTWDLHVRRELLLRQLRRRRLCRDNSDRAPGRQTDLGHEADDRDGQDDRREALVGETPPAPSISRLPLPPDRRRMRPRQGSPRCFPVPAACAAHGACARRGWRRMRHSLAKCVREYGKRKPSSAKHAYAGVSIAGEETSMSAMKPAAPRRSPSSTMCAHSAASIS
jgi:hypothetical protein